MSGIRILADDLTGALDTAAAFAGNVPVYFGSPPSSADAVSFPVAVVATPTRDVATDALPGFLRPVIDWLKGGGLSFKKVDSLLRGNTFEEVAWIFRHAGFDGALFAPAFPAQGRITQNNRQWIVRQGGESKEAVAVPLQEVFADLGLLAGENVGPTGVWPEIWMPEALSDADLDRIVLQAKTRNNNLLWVGSAGLGNALARSHGLSPAQEKAEPLPRGKGPTVLVSASFQSVLRKQWSLLCSHHTAQAVAEGADAGQLAEAVELARTGAGQVWLDLSPRERISAEQAQSLLAANTHMLVDSLPKPGQLIVIGGDTLLGLCQASGAKALLAHPSIRAGWGCARLMGGIWDGVPCYSRSGAFGTADDLLALYGALNHTTSC